MVPHAYGEKDTMNRKLALGIAGSALALTVATGSILAETAGAAPAAQATATATAAQTTTPRTNSKGGGRYGGEFVQAATEYLGLTRAQIVAEIQAGKSLAQIAQAQNKDVNELIKLARTKLNDRLTQAVTNGKITQAQATAALTAFDTNAQTVVNSTDLATLGGKGGRHGGVSGRGQLVEATASVTGLTAEQVRTELAAGKTYAQIAQEKGKTVDDILAKLRELGEQRLATELQQARDRLNQTAPTPKATATPTT